MTSVHPTDQGNLARLEVPGAYGETEVLWAVRRGDAFAICVPPAVAYGISVETLVTAEPTTEPWLAMTAVVTRSDHGTVRLLPASGRKASEVVLAFVHPMAKAAGLQLGPATVLDPGQASIDVPLFHAQWPALQGCLEQLARDEIIDKWEVADPLFEPLDLDPEEVGMLAGKRVIHGRFDTTQRENSPVIVFGGVDSRLRN